MKCTVAEIIVLEKISEEKVAVSKPTRRITGGEILYKVNNTEWDYIKINKISSIVKDLENKQLINQSSILEELNHTSKIELQNLLSSMGLATSGTKIELAERIMDFNNRHESQIVFDRKNSFYKLTDKGKDILEKNKNVVWMNNNSSEIFDFIDSSISINFFLDKPDIDIKLYLIDKFNKNSLILSNIYYVFEEYKQSYEKLIIAFVIDLDNIIKNIDEIIFDIRARRRYFFSSYEKKFSRLLNYINLDEDQLKETLSLLYKDYVHIKETLSLGEFLNLLLPLVMGDIKSFFVIIVFLEEIAPEDEIDETSEVYEVDSYEEERDIQFLYSRLNELNLEMAEIIKELKRKNNDN